MTERIILTGVAWADIVMTWLWRIMIRAALPWAAAAAAGIIGLLIWTRRD